MYTYGYGNETKKSLAHTDYRSMTACIYHRIFLTIIFLFPHVLERTEQKGNNNNHNNNKDRHKNNGKRAVTPQT